MWCSNCAKNITRPENVDGKICCSLCGRVLDEDNFSQEPTFVKNAAGQSQLSGTFVRTVHNASTVSERTLNEAYGGIEDLMCVLGIDGGSSIAQPAVNLYKIAVERNFTRGRRKELVQASCLYIMCRVKEKPYLLIDFSECIGINVYVLGATFLQLCKLLSFEEHDFVQKPVDPSLFIHRFTDRLFRGPKHNVSTTALLIVASMKRDWMQTGRKPSGLCGAALYISALSHGLKCSKSDIIKVVHVCEATLTKRLIEFENTESGGLTIEEFTMKAEELKQEEIKLLNTGPKASGISEFLCKHKDSGEPLFAHGLCKSCYEDFIKFSGGLSGGLEPPAFQRAERERTMEIEAATDSSKNLDSSTICGLEHKNELLNSNNQRSIKNMSEGTTLQSNTVHDSIDDGIPADVPPEESETLSDIDDIEVDIYLHNEEEKQLKKIIWEELNKEYLEEQAEKEAAAKAAKEAHEAKFANCSEDYKAAQELHAAAAAAVAKSKKEKRQKRAAELKNAGPPRSLTEAVGRQFEKKNMSMSKKLNYDALYQLFDEESENLESNKKSRTEQKSDGEDDYSNRFSTEDAYIENMEEYDYNDDISHFDDDDF
ncbi:hypothetical protein ACS0TY_031887 [Phlomoides rotata]